LGPAGREVSRAEAIIERFEDGGTGDALHDVRGDIGDLLLVGILEILRGFARCEFKPHDVFEVLFLVLPRDQGP
jgi:hypothetical protein